MSQTKLIDKKVPEIVDVFIITPIGANGSDIFIKANGLIDSVINPVLNKMGMKGTAAHQIDASGSINNQIIDRIVNDKLVIANLTGLNPNVMYELAIRHAARKPVIMMADKGVTDRLPFDIQDQRTIFYDDSLAGSVIARAELTKKLNAIDYEEKPDNPIYAAIKLNTMLENVEAGDPTKILLEKMESMLTNITYTKQLTNSKQNLGHIKVFYAINTRFKSKPSDNDKSTFENHVSIYVKGANGENLQFVYRKDDTCDVELLISDSKIEGLTHFIAADNLVKEIVSVF